MQSVVWLVLVAPAGGLSRRRRNLVWHRDPGSSFVAAGSHYGSCESGQSHGRDREAHGAQQRLTCRTITERQSSCRRFAWYLCHYALARIRPTRQTALLERIIVHPRPDHSCHNWNPSTLTAIQLSPGYSTYCELTRFTLGCVPPAKLLLASPGHSSRPSRRHLGINFFYSIRTFPGTCNPEIVTNLARIWKPTPHHIFTGASGMLKRHSFFGRTSSEATDVHKASLPTEMTTHADGSHLSSRPDTAFSDRRRRTEPLDAIRNSIAGLRKRTSTLSPSNRQSVQERRPSSRMTGLFGTQNDQTRHEFTSEDEYYRFLNKGSISPPFNFEHVTHTTQKDVPRLDTVDEKDLTAKFWALSAYDRPKRRLNGIQAVDVTEKLGQIGVSRGSPSSRPTSPVPNTAAESPAGGARSAGSFGTVGNIDETMLDKTKDVSVQPNRSFSPAHLNKRLPNPPKRDSSLGALNDQRLKYLDTPQPSTHEISNPNVYQSRHHASSVPGADEPASTLHSVPEEQAFATSTPSSQYQTGFCAVHETISFVKDVRTFDYKQREALIKTVFTLNAEPSAQLRIDYRKSHDVDFCYEQQAESTCNFDWQNPDPSQVERNSVSEGNGSIRSFIRLPHSSLDMSTPWKTGRKSIEAFVPRTYPPSGMYMRNVPTGHYNRHSSAHPLRNSVNVPPTRVPAHEAAHTSGQTSGVGSKEENSTANLASTIPHAYNGTAGPQATLPARTRWTFTSTHSVPELLRRRSRDQRSTPKLSISQPLETLPQSPVAVNGPNGRQRSQSEAAPGLDTTTTTIRRPESSFERTALQAAGKAVQRSRPPTGNRLSRIESVEQFDERAGWI
ncbi:hypothetical protein KC328_g114 [Hortaea werneckii]|nr:hypothetical protein KC328_g114 [Hortaea werneckii]